MNLVKSRLKEIFDYTIDSDAEYKEDLNNINYYNLICKSATKNSLFRIMGNNLCMFNYIFEDVESILMIFAVSASSKEETSSKNIAEKVFEVIKELEECFVTLDYVRSNHVVEDKFIYITAVKKI